MKILVAGCGSIGRRHMANLKTLGAGDILAVDPSGARRKAAEQDFGVQSFPSLGQALEHKPRAALICSPNSLHCAQAMEAVKAGCHLFVEKPLSHNMDGVDDLGAEAARQKLVTMVGSNFKFHPSFVKMKEILDSGVLGRMLSARCQFGQYLPDWHPWEDYRQGYSAREDLGGGVLLDSHELDYIRWFLGEADQVFCFAGKLSQLEIGTEDTAECLLCHASGAISEVHLDYTQRAYQRNYEFFGELGTLKWGFADKMVRVYLASEKQWTEHPEPQDYDLNQMYVEEMSHFLDCVQAQRPTISTLDSGRKVLALIMAAKQSSATGRAVRLREGLLS